MNEVAESEGAQSPNSPTAPAPAVQTQPEAAAPKSSALATFIAPSVLAVTGTLYLTGYLVRGRAYEDLGFSGEALATSLQATLALGYAALFFYLTVAGGVALVAYMIFALFLENRFSRFQVPQSVKRVSVGYLMLLFMGIGVFIGVKQGDMVVEKVRKNVATGCRSGCFIYQVKNRQYLGDPVGADPERIMVRTRKGARIFELSDIQVVVPYSPGMVLPKLEPEEVATKTAR
jgi:hypothetical protein